MYDPLVVDAFLRVHAEMRSGLSGLGLDDPAPPQLALLEAETGTASPRSPAQRGEPEPSDSWVDLLGDLGRRLLQLGCSAVPVSVGVLYLRNVRTDKLVVAHVVGTASSELSHLEIGVGQGVSGWVAANRRGMTNCDASLDLGPEAHIDGAPLKSCLSVPVVLGDRLLGVLTLYSTETDRFSQQHALLLDAQVRGFVSDLGSRSQTLDAGESNSASAEQSNSLSRVFMHGQLYGQSVAVLLLRMQIPEGKSEASRQETLAWLDRTVRESVRGGDLTLRTSNTEVLVILPQGDTSTARNTAERIARAVRGRESAVCDRPNASAHIVYGVAASPDDGGSFESLLDAARGNINSPLTGVAEASPTVH